MVPTCVLYESADKSVVVVDVPRSVELAQVAPGHDGPGRRLLSSKPLDEPWQAPRSGKARSASAVTSQPHSAAIDELMTRETARAALQETRLAYAGPWCLPRIQKTLKAEDAESAEAPSKRKSSEAGSRDQIGTDDQDDSPPPHIPAESQYLLGSIEDQREAFSRTAPSFDLIILDPPWPSRSVRRKRDGYTTAYGMQDIDDLLSLVPVGGHLKPDGLVAVWVTNKPAVIDLLKSQGGVFDRWGLEPVAEWIWVKVTRTGEPVVDLDSTWRQPWERLVLARRKGGSARPTIARKVIFGVPDLHSRKPNLRPLFEDVFVQGCIGLEVFARNLTCGWWSWGNQVLMFQQRHHWAEEESAQGNE
jgi:N6-adenosine-specific RNA methylase IME4